MKISQEEIVAAYNAWRSNAGTQEVVWTAILEAAYTVRKQRKASKRERQRKEKDKQVVESAKPSIFGTVSGGALNLLTGTFSPHEDKQAPSKAPEWDGNASAFDAAMKPKA